MAILLFLHEFILCGIYLRYYRLWIGMKICRGWSMLENKVVLEVGDAVRLRS